MVVESNGGSVSVTVRAEVPTMPFAQGVLAGATTPRQLAEKAKAAPREAAAFFENGTVQQWYQDNGWTYPVQGPNASGLGAVQQFFEALGLAKAPRVEMAESAIFLRGKPGEKLRHNLVVRSTEKRPVFAHARSDQPWLMVGLVQLQGATATVLLEVSPVPQRPGQTLQANVTVTANGNQQFVLPVTLTVDRATNVKSAAAAAVVPALAVLLPEAMKPTVTMAHADTDIGDSGTGRKTQSVRAGRPSSAAAAPPSRRPRTRPREEEGGGNTLKYVLAAFGALLLLVLGGGFFVLVSGVLNPAAEKDESAAKKNGPVNIALEDDRTEKVKGGKKKPGKTITVVQVKDEGEEVTRLVVDQPGAPVVARVVEEKDEGPPPMKPRTEVVIKDEPAEGPAGAAGFPLDPNPLVRYQRGGAEFGITAVRDRRGQPLNKLITYSPVGQTSRTIIRVNNTALPLVNLQQAAGPDQQLPDDRNRRAYFRSERVYRFGKLTLRHILEIVPSKQPAVVNGQKKRLLDTVLVRYIFENADTKAYTFGMRAQVDTLIGGNDGVPFTIPGYPGLVNTFADFRTPMHKMPTFIQALEFPNLQNPGTVALMTIQVGGKVEPPARMSLTAWPSDRGQYEVPVTNMGNDSCVVLYWPDKQLKPRQRREMGYAYGLGAVDAGEAGGKFAITLNGNFEPGQQFTTTALFTNPKANQLAQIQVPPGLTVEGAANVKVPAANAGAAVVTWNVKVEKPGEFRVSVISDGVKQSKLISITQKEAPNLGKLAMKLDGSYEIGESFNVTVTATEFPADQTLTLKLPKELELNPPDGSATQLVPEADKDTKAATVRWKVKVKEHGTFPVRVESSNGLAKTATLTVQKQTDLGRFTLKLDGQFEPGKTFTVKALVTRPAPKQTLSLDLPKELTCTKPDLVQTVPAADGGETSTVSWEVKVGGLGQLPMRVRSSLGLTKVVTLDLRQKTEGAVEAVDNFRLSFAGDIAPGKEFQLIAKVTNPVPGQKLTFRVPSQLKLVEGPATQTVPATPGIHEVAWRVRVVDIGRIPMVVDSTTGFRKTKTVTLTSVEKEKTQTGGNIFGK